jgi:lipopolysaccharide/colanic/teichoic acid biosynthesis glycosyltransferase
MLAQMDALPVDGSLDEQIVENAELVPVAGHLAVKYAFDLVLAAILLVVLAPILVVLMVLVKLTSRGPALYRQVRLGCNGRQFWIFKLRSMAHDCERESGPKWSPTNDPRVTHLGRFLRKTHLDELPQLWNVLRGDMSLIGPRPERPEFAMQLERVIPGYRDRLLVRPGVTGLAQVQLPPDTDIDSVRRKVEVDRYYIERMSLLLDLKILLATATKVVGVPCSLACRLLGVPTGEVLTTGNESTPAVNPKPASRQLVVDPA